MAETPADKLILILGEEGYARVRAARVMVLGLGGVGSNCAEALIRGGVGSLVVLDHDVVAPSNINRQAIAFQSTVGQPKVAVMAAMAEAIDPAIAVKTIDCFLTSANVVDTIAPYAEEVDFVVDCIDAISVKLTLAAWAQDQPFRLISSMGAANKLDPEKLRICDLYETVNDPLARVMRKEGRKRGIRALKVISSSEAVGPKPIPASTTRRQRLNLGTVSYLPPIMGQMLAGYVIRALAFETRDD